MQVNQYKTFWEENTTPASWKSLIGLSFNEGKFSYSLFIAVLVWSHYEPQIHWEQGQISAEMGRYYKY